MASGFAETKLGTKPPRVYKCLVCGQRRNAKLHTICDACAEIEAAREFERLMAEYWAEQDKAYAENRDPEENVIFELSVKVISICERYGWDVPAAMR